MKDKIVLITGSTDGIGKKTAFDLAKEGVKVIIHGRNQEKTENVFKEIQEKTENKNLDFVVSDFISMNEIKKMSELLKNKYEKIDVLINNVGMISKKKEFSKEGIESVFMVNYLSTFMNTLLLFDLVKNSELKHILNISSMMHSNMIEFDNLQGEKNFDPYKMYAISKLCVILFSYYLEGNLNSDKVYINSMHPGVINTKLLENRWIGGSSADFASENIRRVVRLQKDSLFSGKYFVSKRMTISSRISYSAEAQKKLWEISEKLTDIHFSF